MRKRLKRVADRAHKIIAGHLEESMEDIHTNLGKIKAEVREMRAVMTDPDAGVEAMVDSVMPGLDAIEGLVDSIIEAK